MAGLFVGAGLPVGTTYNAYCVAGGVELSIQLKVALFDVVTAVIPVGLEQGSGVQFATELYKIVSGAPSPGAFV